MLYNKVAINIMKKKSYVFYFALQNQGWNGLKTPMKVFEVNLQWVKLFNEGNRVDRKTIT